MKTLRALGVASFVVVLASMMGACSSTDFDPYSKVESVRILATRGTPPSPIAPGASTDLDVLAFDGRADQTRPMRLFWFPDPCIDPADDGYYSCYPDFRARYPVGVDLTSQLHEGTRMTVTMPPDVISRHTGPRGNAPYGLAVVFLMACAGHVEAIPPPAGQGPEAIPFGCFDDQHRALGPNDWVFSYSSIFSYTNQQNTDPIIDHLTLRGVPIDPAAGITLDHCTQSKIDDCPTTPLDIVVPDSSWELNPANLDVDGNVLHEQIWVDYLLTGGKVKNDVITLFDSRTGRLPSTVDDLYAPQAAGDYSLWAVVRDDRGGVTWLTLPLHAR